VLVGLELLAVDGTPSDRIDSETMENGDLLICSIVLRFRAPPWRRNRGVFFRRQAGFVPGGHAGYRSSLCANLCAKAPAVALLTYHSRDDLARRTVAPNRAHGRERRRVSSFS